MSRPIKLIDWQKADQMLVSGCTGTEVASHFGMHADTFYKRCEKEKGMGFTAYLQQKQSTGNALIRVAQFDEAVRKRDRGMLIWLGKNRLGQTDKETVEHKGNVPVEIVNFGSKEIKPWRKDETDIKRST